jgi:hypothetical protein
LNVAHPVTDSDTGEGPEDLLKKYEEVLKADNLILQSNFKIEIASKHLVPTSKSSAADVNP